jgi:biopolymer transport protein ExbD
MSVNIKRKSNLRIGVPTASLPDIIFQLLIFFMVSTVLREHSGLVVILPEANKVQKLESKRHISTIWIDQQSRIIFDDRTIKNVGELRRLAYQKLLKDPRLIISLKIDKNANMGIVIDVQQELRKANTLRVNYSTHKIL